MGNAERFAELVSMREIGDGTINIVPKLGYQIESGDSVSQIKEEHISLHPSDDSTGTSIKMTIKTAAGLINSHVIVANSKNNLVWPVFTRAIANLSHDDFQYAYSRPSEEKIVFFETIDQSSSLLYTIVAQRKGGALPEVEHFNLRIAEFSRFRVGVYVTHLHVLPTHRSTFTSLVTQKQKNDGETIDKKTNLKHSPNFATHQLQRLLLLCCEKVSRVHARNQMHDSFDDLLEGRNPEIMDIVSQQGVWISKYPPNEKSRLGYTETFLNWICNIDEIDDHKKFNKALLWVVARQNYTDYNLSMIALHKFKFENGISTYFNGMSLANFQFGASGFCMRAILMPHLKSNDVRILSTEHTLSNFQQYAFTLHSDKSYVMKRYIYLNRPLVKTGSIGPLAKTKTKTLHT